MKKLNQRGFTVVELLTSFSLATVVMILLFNILLSIKEGYISHKAVAEANIDQAFISRIIHEDSQNYVLTSAPTISGNIITLSVECISDACGIENKIQYSFSNDSFTKTINGKAVNQYTLSENTSVSTPLLSNEKKYGEMRYYMLTIPLKNAAEDFSVKVYFSLRY